MGRDVAPARVVLVWPVGYASASQSQLLLEAASSGQKGAHPCVLLLDYELAVPAEGDVRRLAGVV